MLTVTVPGGTFDGNGTREGLLSVQNRLYSTRQRFGMIQVVAVWRLAARRHRDARLHDEDSASHNEDESSGYDSNNGDDGDVDP